MNGARSMQKVTEPECRQAIHDFEKTLINLEKRVFHKLGETYFRAKQHVSWVDLRDCWSPAPSTGKDPVQRQHVAALVGTLKIKLAAWCSKRRVEIGIASHKPSSKEACVWNLTFSYTSQESPEKPSFIWSVRRQKGSKEHLIERALPIWVPHFDTDSIRINIHPIDDWKQPSTIPDYNKYREDVWETHKLEHRQSAVNTLHFGIQSCVLRPSESGNYDHVHLVALRTQFKDFLATTRRLQQPIKVGDENQTVEQLLRNDWRPEDGSFFPPAANLVAVDVNVITSDRKIILRKEFKEGPWETSIFGFMNALTDVYRTDIHNPDPRETVFQKSCQLLGINLRPAFVRWLGIGLGFQKGNVSIFGEIKVPYTFEQILKLYERRLDPSRSYQIKAIDLCAESFVNILDSEENRHRRHMEAAVVLSLYRRSKGLLKITSRST